LACDDFLTVTIAKNNKPSIYLDTCAMIELSRYEKGICKNEHSKKIGELYNVLTALMREKRILCPSGNQLQEMGMTANRKSARSFLYQFTNCELFHPELVQIRQMQAGYHAFSSNCSAIELDIHTAFEEKRYLDSPFDIRVDLVCSPQKAADLSEEKKNVAAILNEMKSNKLVEATFEELLHIELEAEYILFISALSDSMASDKACMRYLEEIEKFYRITGFSPTTDTEQHKNHLASYTAFLLSSYHDVLPYIWIRASMWTHIMRRKKTVLHSDNLDIQWAAAYLPFVDYVVTDNACYRLLQESRLAERYGTKVYSFKTLESLLDELACLNN